MNNKNLTIIIVLYNASNLIFECLNKLNSFKIIIVDNGKNQKILEEIRNYKNVKNIISKNRNIGFGNGINFAFNYIDTNFFMVLNPDLEIDELSINELLKTSMNDSRCAISAPYILPDNDSYGLFPENGKGMPRNAAQLKSSKLLDNLKPSGNLCVNVSKGCALLINSKHFKDVGMFSSEYFLFWEEIDLCRKFFKKKLSVIVNPKSVAKHKEGNSTKKSFFMFLLRTFHSEKSALYYFNVKKYSFVILKKTIKYLLRAILYLPILNFKNSFKNFAKFYANLSYIFF
jgi:GT2 family glycosyltransferase